MKYIKRLISLGMVLGLGTVVTADETMSLRIAAQIKALAPGHPLAEAPLAWYSVTALSPVKRLPDTFPVDGELGGELRLIATPGEFEPASFVVFAFGDMDGVRLQANPLRGSHGDIPAANLDLKIVKLWYQGGTGWYSYFADQTGRTLVPELLLNDETLIRVDHETQDNYLRVDYPSGPEYVWISNPLAVEIPFNTQTAPVADAPTLQPFQLAGGVFKQFWLTVKVPDNMAGGLYTGSITLTWKAETLEIPVRLRVLPFTLPTPRTYYDLDREFYSLLYNRPRYGEIIAHNGGNREHADRKMLAIFKNMRDHNIRNPLVRDIGHGLAPGLDAREIMTRELELMRDAGLGTAPIFGGIPGIPPHEWMLSVRQVPIEDQVLPAELIERVDTAAAVIQDVLGHHDVYCIGWDEPAIWMVHAQRRFWQHLHSRGFKIFSTGHGSHLQAGGYNQDMINLSGPARREHAEAWHQIGARILNYAGPHTGPENPDFMRRVHGLQLYKANYDGIGNYILDSTRWNDFLGDASNFRGFNMTYGTRDSVIDTLHWEGMREALDDVRYATLLRQLAHRAMSAGPPPSSYAGRQALLWLELLDEKRADLNAVRLEMIDRILKLTQILDADRGAE